MKVEIRNVFAFEGRAAHYTGEDGYPQGYPVPGIVATDHTGREWSLPNSFHTTHDEDGFGPFPVVRYDLQKAREIAAAVADRGWVDGEHWIELPTIEEEWGDDPMGAWHGRNE